MNVALPASAFTVRLRFHGDLSCFLRSPRAQLPLVEKRLHEKTSVKDVIESCGVPHTEVDLIVAKDAPVGFSHQLLADAEIDVFPVPAPPELFPASRLQERGLKRFVADGHLGKLVRDLRLLGFDIIYDNNATDEALLAVAAAEERALLTRDRRLLMHGVLRHGYCPRSHLHEEQTREVIARFSLGQAINPWTRCVHCNGLLAPVDKAEIFEQLEPLTKIYYQEFCRCAVCAKIYWPGSHFGKLQARIERIRNPIADL